MSTSSILDTIGNTPLLQITRFDTGLCTLFVKLESQNPSGSIKDRIAASMIKAAEDNGLLKPGGVIVEATAGNTGLGLALVAAVKGYRLILVIPDKMSREKILHLQALGAEIRITRSDVAKGHPEYYHDLAEKITQETPGAVYINQFDNAANPLSHEQTTGPEIWHQMEGNVDAVVAGVGSGGTITGLSRYFARVASHVEMVLADPAGSILDHYIKTKEISDEIGSWRVEGIGEDFIPPGSDLSYITQSYAISDTESFTTARELLKKEGILAGSSAGTLVAAALRYCREQTIPKRVVTFICDSGNKYLSKMYSDQWMQDNGYLAKTSRPGLEKIISRHIYDGNLVTLAPNDTLATAYARMRLYDISQLPVIENDIIIGILDESDILLAAHTHSKDFSGRVKDFMTGDLLTLSPQDSVDDLIEILRRGMVALIVDKGRFLGVITKVDLLQYFRTLQEQ